MGTFFVGRPIVSGRTGRTGRVSLMHWIIIITL